MNTYIAPLHFSVCSYDDMIDLFSFWYLYAAASFIAASAKIRMGWRHDFSYASHIWYSRESRRLSLLARTHFALSRFIFFSMLYWLLLLYATGRSCLPDDTALSAVSGAFISFFRKYAAAFLSQLPPLHTNAHKVFWSIFHWLSKRLYAFLMILQPLLLFYIHIHIYHFGLDAKCRAARFASGPVCPWRPFMVFSHTHLFIIATFRYFSCQASLTVCLWHLILEASYFLYFFSSTFSLLLWCFSASRLRLTLRGASVGQWGFHIFQLTISFFQQLHIFAAAWPLASILSHKVLFPFGLYAHIV